MDWISIVKNLLSLVVTITNMIGDAQQRGLGRIEATNEALLNAQQDIAYASAIAEDAERELKANPAGTSEDRDFEVPDGQ
jgi:hypothetical protein